MTAPLARLQHALAGRYLVEQELGRGGMATVYLGRDLRLERRVAIKVFERDEGVPSHTERFLREIQIAARLQHPNILPVFESGEGEGLVYYVMPYVAGGSLAERIEREGALPIDEAVRIAREVAAALDHAHQAGIVHRDIKPGNIMLASGVAVVADFGIARALEESGLRVTETGLAIGTPAYMSPEQAAAKSQLDGRSDIYALGCVLYEMLAGAPPFNGPTAQSVMLRHATDPVPPLSTVRPLSAELEGVVGKALAKLPGDRWATARALADALAGTGITMGVKPTPPRRSVVPLTVGAVLLAALLVVLVPRLTRRAPAGSAVRDLPSIAVLPFALIGDSSQAHVASGLTEALITALVRVGGLRVPGLGTVSQFEGREQDPQAIGQSLRVDNVLIASVQIEGQRLRVTPRVVRVTDRQSIWSDHFDGSMVDIFAMQDSITRNIVSALQIRLTNPSRATVAMRSRTKDAQAYDFYLRGQRAKWKATLQGAQEALNYFGLAIERDSNFADAWVGSAIALDWIAQFGGLPPIQIVGRYRDAVQRGIQLDSTHPGALLNLARFRLNYEWDFGSHDRLMRRAIELYPDYADLHLIYGQDLHIVGLPDSALAENRQAAALDPTSAFAVANVAFSLTSMGRFDEAAPFYRRVVSLDSLLWWVPIDAAAIASFQGRHEDAAREIERVHKILGDVPWVLPYVVGCSRQARPEVAAAAMARLETLSRQQYVQPVFMAQARLYLGNRSAALDGLEASFNARDRDFLWKLGQGEFEALRGDPRYETILRGTGLDRFMRPPSKFESRGPSLYGCR